MDKPESISHFIDHAFYTVKQNSPEEFASHDVEIYAVVTTALQKQEGLAEDKILTAYEKEGKYRISSMPLQEYRMKSRGKAINPHLLVYLIQRTFNNMQQVFETSEPTVQNGIYKQENAFLEKLHEIVLSYNSWAQQVGSSIESIGAVHSELQSLYEEIRQRLKDHRSIIKQENPSDNQFNNTEEIKKFIGTLSKEDLEVELKKITSDIAHTNTSISVLGSVLADIVQKLQGNPSDKDKTLMISLMENVEENSNYVTERHSKLLSFKEIIEKEIKDKSNFRVSPHSSSEDKSKSPSSENQPLQ